MTPPDQCTTFERVSDLQPAETEAASGLGDAPVQLTKAVPDPVPSEPPIRQALWRAASPVLTVIGVATLLMAVSATWFNGTVVAAGYTRNDGKFAGFLGQPISLSTTYTNLHRLIRLHEPVLFDAYFGWLIFAGPVAIAVLALAAAPRTRFVPWLRGSATVLAVALAAITWVASRQGSTAVERSVIGQDISRQLNAEPNLLMVAAAVKVKAGPGPWIAIIASAFLIAGAATGPWGSRSSEQAPDGPAEPGETAAPAAPTAAAPE